MNFNSITMLVIVFLLITAYLDSLSTVSNTPFK